MITKVTFTGADDSVRPADIVEMSKEYPFIEWGILVSESQYGNWRFPSKQWLKDLCQAVWRVDHDVQLSLHACGSLVRNTLNKPKFKHLTFLLEDYPIFQRVQLNTHAHLHEFDKEFFFHLPIGQQYIFQSDGTNTPLIDFVVNGGLNIGQKQRAHVLFDTSHGAGVLPGSWPEPISGTVCGYAGGLGPDNLKAQIPLIEGTVGGEKIWIDMETRVRSLDDAVFDLYKVRQCAEIAKPYVWQKDEEGQYFLPIGE